MGRRHNSGRQLHGILLLDKPLHCTSNRALQQVKRLYQARKAGHTGSLDPLATGLLPICFGIATRLSAFLLDADKHYTAHIRLGTTTATGDAEGELLQERPAAHIRSADIQAVLPQFCGQIQQLPPMYSAVHHQGKRLYALARAGITVERQPRTVTIHALHFSEYKDQTLVLQVHCSKGTYVRTLAEAIGEALGCGAHLSGLRRTGVGPYRAQPMYAMSQLQTLAAEGQSDTILLPADSAVPDWPLISLTPDQAYYVLQGQAVRVAQAPLTGWVRLYQEDTRFLGIGEILSDGRVAPRRLLSQ
ncbi:MAG: tRNA pseudouridine(55) synthase TruB [Pseudomonadota bacterium]